MEGGEDEDDSLFPESGLSQEARKNGGRAGRAGGAESLVSVPIFKYPFYLKGIYIYMHLFKLNPPICGEYVFSKLSFRIWWSGVHIEAGWRFLGAVGVQVRRKLSQCWAHVSGDSMEPTQFGCPDELSHQNRCKLEGLTGPQPCTPSVVESRPRLGQKGLVVSLWVIFMPHRCSSQDDCPKRHVSASASPTQRWSKVHFERLHEQNELSKKVIRKTWCFPAAMSL